MLPIGFGYSHGRSQSGHGYQKVHLQDASFFIWLASLNQCWTTDRLARRGLDHPDHCPLCDQEDETIQHILTSCVFAREIWFRVLSLVGLQQLTPSQDDLVFQEWWRLALTRVLEQQQKGFNSLVVETP